jgi:ABC-2 type transport system permease protein
MKLADILKEEVKNLMRGRYPVIWIIFCLPLLFTVLFGTVYQQNVVKYVPLVIYDQDQSSLSRTVIQAYGDSERFRIVSQVYTQEDMEQAIYNGTALAGLGIPRDFSKNVKQGTGTDVVLIVNSNNNMFANAAMGAAWEINRSVSVAVSQKLFEGMGQLPDAALKMAYPVRMGIRILNNPTAGYTPFMLSGLMLNGLQIAIMLVAAPLFSRELLRRQYAVSCPAWKIVLGKTIPCWLAAVLSFAICIVTMHYFYAVPLKGDLMDLFVISSAFIFFVIQVIFLFAAFAPNEVMSIQLPLLYIMPGLLYSGLSWPAFHMNEFAVFFAALLPMTYGADNVRDLLLAGYAPALWQDTAYMILFGCICSLLAGCVLSLRRRYTAQEIIAKISPALALRVGRYLKKS